MKRSVLLRAAFIGSLMNFPVAAVGQTAGVVGGAESAHVQNQGKDSRDAPGTISLDSAISKYNVSIEDFLKVGGIDITAPLPGSDNAPKELANLHQLREHVVSDERRIRSDYLATQKDIQEVQSNGRFSPRPASSFSSEDSPEEDCGDVPRRPPADDDSVTASEELISNLRKYRDTLNDYLERKGTDHVPDLSKARDDYQDCIATPRIRNSKGASCDTLDQTYRSLVHKSVECRSLARARLYDASDSIYFIQNKLKLKKLQDTAQGDISALDKVSDIIATIDERSGQIVTQFNQNSNNRELGIYLFTALAIGIVITLSVLSLMKESIARRIFQDNFALQFITIFTLIFSIVLFGLYGILEGRELSALLGGISGYILGKGAEQASRGEKYDGAKEKAGDSDDAEGKPGPAKPPQAAKTEQQ
jgi:hypothetical protein